MLYDDFKYNWCHMSILKPYFTEIDLLFIFIVCELSFPMITYALCRNWVTLSCIYITNNTSAWNQVYNVA